MRNFDWMHNYQQTYLFGETNPYVRITAFNSRVIVGQFFELLTSKLFKKYEILSRPNGCDVQPDGAIWNVNNHDIIFECKATTRDAPLIDLSQHDNYKELKDSLFPFTDPEIYYILYSYTTPINGLIKGSHTVDELIQNLCDGIECAIVLPIEIINRIVEVSDKKKYGKWQGYARDEYVRFKPSIFRVFKIPNKDSIFNGLKLMGLSEEELKPYRVRKYSIKDKSVIDKDVKTFPLSILSTFDRWKRIHFKGSNNVN